MRARGTPEGQEVCVRMRGCACVRVCLRTRMRISHRVCARESARVRVLVLFSLPAEQSDDLPKFLMFKILAFSR